MALGQIFNEPYPSNNYGNADGWLFINGHVLILLEGQAYPFVIEDNLEAVKAISQSVLEIDPNTIEGWTPLESTTTEEWFESLPEEDQQEALFRIDEWR